MGINKFPSFDDHFLTQPKWAGSFFVKSLVRGKSFKSIISNILINDLATIALTIKQFDHKTRKLPYRIITHFLLTSIVNVNVYFLFTEGAPGSYRLLDFMKVLMRQLACGEEATVDESNSEDGAIGEQQTLPPVMPRVKIARSKTLEKDVQKRLVHGHHVEYTEERGTCKARCNPGGRQPRI
jgi:hypothetical protein